LRKTQKVISAPDLFYESHASHPAMMTFILHCYHTELNDKVTVLKNLRVRKRNYQKVKADTPSLFQTRNAKAFAQTAAR
jgi:hypothetical protein